MNWLDEYGEEAFIGGIFRLQWVSSALKDIKLASEQNGGSLPLKHTACVRLLRLLEHSSAHTVRSSCDVLTHASTRLECISSSLLLPELVARASTSPCYPVLLECVADFLIYQLNKPHPTRPHPTSYAIRVNEHPLVSVLESRKEAGNCIVRQTLRILAAHQLSRSSVDLVSPVLKYLVLHPAPPPYIATLRPHLYSSLILLLNQNIKAPPTLSTLLAELLPFQPIGSTEQLLYTSSCASSLSAFNSRLPSSLQQGLLTSQLSLCVELSGRSLSVQPLLDVLEVRVQDLNSHLLWQPHHYVALGWLLLHHCTSPSITHQLLHILRGVVFSKGVSAVRSCLVLPLVQLLSLPPSSLLPLQLDHAHTGSNQTMAKTLLEQVQSPKIPSQGMTMPPSSPATPPSDEVGPAIFKSSSFFSLLASSTFEYINIASDSDSTCSWLHQLAKQSRTINRVEGCGHLALLVACAAMAYADSANILDAAQKAFNCLCGVDPAITPSVVHLVLYLLDSTPVSSHKLTLLYSLPNLPAHSLALGGVVSTIDLLSRHVSLLPVAMRLMCKLWLKHDRVFSYLRGMLTRPLPASPPSVGVVREVALAKAAVIRDICRERPEQHGEEMLAFISKMLTSHYQDAAVVAMALEGVVSLCLSEVVDVVTVWEVIGTGGGVATGRGVASGGKLATDDRVVVVVSLCPLLALAADIVSEHSSSHKTFKETALCLLWRGAFCKVAAVSEASLQALTHFKLEDFFWHHLPQNIQELLVSVSGDQSHDLSPVQLTGDVCVQLVHALPEGALTAYSSFLAGVMREELRDLPRGLVHMATRKAEAESAHETSLRATNHRLIKEFHSSWSKPVSDLTKGNVRSSFFAAGEGLLACQEFANEVKVEGKDLQSHGATLSGGRGKKGEDGVERDMAVLRSLVKEGHHLIVDLDRVPLWEGVACISSAHQWQLVQHVCYKLYEVRLGSVRVLKITPSQIQQAHSWALTKVLDLLTECVRKDSASCIGAFFAAVGVAYFKPPQCAATSSQLLPASESLLIDLIQAAGEVLCKSGRVYSYSHPLVKFVLESEHAQLSMAVIMAFPLLFGSALEWSGQSQVMDELVVLLGNMWDYFSSGPTWYCSVVLSQVLVQLVPRYHQFLQPVLDKLLPFLEEVSNAASLQLLSLMAPFVGSLLVLPDRQESSLSLSLYAALRSKLVHLDPDLLASSEAELCTYHYSRVMCGLFAAGLLSADQTTAAISLLVSIVTATSSATSHWSLGHTLFCLSAAGHRQAHTLAQDVATKWLKQLNNEQDEEILESVLVGLAGMVGCGWWEEPVAIADHVTLMQNITYLLVDAAGKLMTNGGQSVSEAARWARHQALLNTVALLDHRDRVPGDLSFLPASSCLRSAFFLATSLTTGAMEDISATKRTSLLTSLISAVSSSCGLAEQPFLPPGNSQPLPPADYSSLLLPAVLHYSGNSPDLVLAGLGVVCAAKGRRGVSGLVLSLTSPLMFPFLPFPAKVAILEKLPVFTKPLTSRGRYKAFLHECVSMVTRSNFSDLTLTAAFVRGLARVVAMEGNLPEFEVQVAVATASLLCSHISTTVARAASTWEANTQSELLTYLMDSGLWGGLADCLAPVEKEDGNTFCICVQCALICAQVLSSKKTFSALHRLITWLLQHQGEKESIIVLHLVLHTLSSCCVKSCPKASQHQIEILNVLSAWVSNGSEKKKVSSIQWKLWLLLLLVGSGVPLGFTAHVSGTFTEQMDSLLQAMLLSSSTVQTTATVREKLCKCLIEGLVSVADATDLASVKTQFMKALSGLVDIEAYRRGIVWTTPANLI